MKTYVRIEEVEAKPMTDFQFNQYMEADVLNVGDTPVEGYFIGLPSITGIFNGPIDDRYYHIAWLPTEIFEEVYK